MNKRPICKSTIIKDIEESTEEKSLSSSNNQGFLRTQKVWTIKEKKLVHWLYGMCKFYGMCKLD